MHTKIETSNISKSEKLTFISNEIENLIAMKNSSENNIVNITKYYSLVLTAFFAYIVFYSGVHKDEIKAIYAILGLCFVAFATASTYYTTYTIIKNLKRRILYRREITSLRSLANQLMDNLYTKKTICQLDSNKINFTSFDNLPTIAIFIGTGTPIISFIFINDLFVNFFSIPKLISFQITFSVCIVITLAVLAGILNLYTVHRKEYLVAIRSYNKKEEKRIINAVDRMNDSKRKMSEYKALKNYQNIFILLLLLTIPYKIFFYMGLSKWNWDINLLELLCAIFITTFLVKKNRFFNMKHEKFKLN